MGTFYDSCHLIEYSRSNGPTIIKQSPEDYDLGRQKDSFLSCSFPETQENGSIYSFSISRKICFAWSFIFKDSIYSIVISSHHSIPHLFLEFLKACKSPFNIDPPEERLEAIILFISQWKFNPITSQIHVVYPTHNFTTLLDATHTFFMQFDPSVLIGNIAVLDEVWNSMITGRGVLLIGDSAYQVSCAVYSALSLVAPLKFSDHLLLYTKIGDKRFAEIINGSKKWKIVGTTNELASERCKQFYTVIHIPSTPVAPQPELRDEIQKRMNKIVRKVEKQLNNCLAMDPYYDLLQTPLTESQISTIVSKIKFSSSDFRLFQNSRTYIEWRKSIIFRSHFRDSILSFPPESIVEKKTDSELAEMLSILTDIIQKMSGDAHIIAVLNMHLKHIKYKLSKIGFPFIQNHYP